MDILDYGVALQNSPNPLSSALNTAGQMQGLQQNAQILQQNRQAIEQQALDQANMQKALQEGANLLMSDDYNAQAQFMLNNPQVREQFMGVMNFMNNAQMSDRIEFNKSVLAGAGDPRIALQERIAEVKSKGGDTANLEDTLALNDPEAIRDTLRKELSFMAPDVLLSAEAAMAGGTPMTQYQKEYLEMKKAEQEVARLKTQQASERNELAKDKLQLDIDEKQEKINETRNKIQEKELKLEFETQAVKDEGQAVLDLIDRIENHEGFSDAIGMKGVSSLFGLRDPLGGTAAADVQTMIDTLEAKGFLTAVGNFKSKGGSGSLSDNEGKKLAASIASLDTNQSEEGFRQSLQVIRDLVTQGMETAQAKKEKRSGEPQWYIDSTPEQKTIIDQLRDSGVSEEEINQILQGG